MQQIEFTELQIQSDDEDCYWCGWKAWKLAIKQTYTELFKTEDTNCFRIRGKGQRETTYE